MGRSFDVRLVTFNILHGRSVADGVVSADRLAAAVRALDPDVLALQEVDFDQPRSEHADLTAVAAQAMGAVSHRFVAALSGTPGATWMAATGSEQPRSAAYGIALLSRYPAQSWQTLPGPGRVMVVREEPRAAVIAQLETPCGTLTVANTHLSFVPGWNRVQLRRLRRDLAGMPGPRILMGDLNMTPPGVAAGSGMRPLATAPTFPSTSPDRQLDHVLADDSLAVLGCSTPAMPISDHRPLVVDVTGFDSSRDG
jgi:endonuclease/exonuclease/phosphatase family metal-dependent hydrolase